MPTKDYKEFLLEQLEDIDEAAEYLTASYEDSEEVFLLALRDVVEAHGGVGKLAKGTELNRENLYRMLSEEGNPQLSSISAILDELGLRLQFTRKTEKEAA